MVNPKTEVLAEFDRHTTRLFKLLNGLPTKTDRNAEAILKELDAHKKKALAAVEADLIVKKVA